MSFQILLVFNFCGCLLLDISRTTPDCNRCWVQWLVYLSNWVYLLGFQINLIHEIAQNMHVERNSYQTILDMNWLNCFHNTYFVWFHGLNWFKILEFAYIFSSSFSPLYQTCPKQYYGGLGYRIINTNTRICYQSVIILDRGSSTLEALYIRELTDK